MRLGIASGLALVLLVAAMAVLTTFRLPSTGVAERDSPGEAVLVIEYDCPWLAPADG